MYQKATRHQMAKPIIHRHHSEGTMGCNVGNSIDSSLAQRPLTRPPWVLGLRSILISHQGTRSRNPGTVQNSHFWGQIPEFTSSRQPTVSKSRNPDTNTASFFGFPLNLAASQTQTASSHPLPRAQLSAPPAARPAPSRARSPAWPR